MTRRPRVAAVLEARCWLEQGVITGRQRAAALDEVVELADLTVISRSTVREVGGQPVIRAAHSWVPLAGIRGIIAALRTLKGSDAVVVFVPGIVSLLLGPISVLTRRRLVCVVVGDPMQSLSPSVIPGAKGWLARHAITASMRWLLGRAEVVRYVTCGYLQSAYPVPWAKSFSATDAKPRLAARTTLVREPRAALRLLTVGTLDRPYKGIPDLVHALDACGEVGGPLELLVAGTGRLQATQVEARLSDVITVTPLGQLGEQQLAEAYASVDLFVLASWTEGLPRTLVEAMFAGLPCVATRVGGVPELLEECALAEPRDIESLASVLRPFITDAALRTEQGVRNRFVVEHLLARAAEEAKAFAREVVKP